MTVDKSVADAARRLGTFGKRHGLSLGDLTVKGPASREQAVSRFVLDASTVLTWCFPDQAAQKAQEVSERIAGGDTVIVPPFWCHEILNALLVGEKT